MDEVCSTCPEKLASERTVFDRIHPGNRIFVGTGCAEPQHLVSTLVSYVQKNPKALVDAEVISIVTLGIAPYANEKFKQNFRLNSFFISESTRGAINSTAADYTPSFPLLGAEAHKDRQNSPGCGLDPNIAT